MIDQEKVNYDDDEDDDVDDDGDDDGDHPLLLSITVARWHCPALSFAALWLHIHLMINIHLMMNIHLITYIHLINIHLMINVHKNMAPLKCYHRHQQHLQPLFSLSCDTDHRLTGNPCVPNFDISLSPSAHLLEGNKTNVNISVSNVGKIYVTDKFDNLKWLVFEHLDIWFLVDYLKW